MKRLAAGCGAHVKHRISRPEPGRLHHQHGTHILHCKGPLPVAFQILDALRLLHRSGIGQIGMFLHRHTVLPPHFHKPLPLLHGQRFLQPDADRFSCQKRFQDALAVFRPVHAAKMSRQPYRHGIAY